MTEPVVYLPDYIWELAGDDAVHASAARLLVTAKRWPPYVDPTPDRVEPNRADRRAAARKDQA